MTRKKTKADAPKAFSDILKPLQAASSVNPLLKPQIEQFWDAQEKFLDETERFAHHWFERRHEAIRTALTAARAATAEGRADPAKAMEAMLDWQRHSMERLVEDAREWLDTMSRCASYATETEAEAVEETLEEAAEIARKSTKSAKSEPV
ncbi:hypothetical protein AVO45_13515 [Ruegeria marisrubri]|uniref:Phasin domain-containing protein n=1 Tax=Ruegeria marisrubri TaxID=1685379 RepID=A0A0X3TCV3_9RHOB|nr:phasin family protein [Ruegeria marisrubri]KUJ73617.1 hypothetical protein AVO45_13515 [Ruegeria marisrubri]